MNVIAFSAESASPISEFGSRGARAQALADGDGESHVYFIHVEAGGVIGPHPAGFDQLFLVTSGSGWVARADGLRQALSAGQGAVITRGEIHSKGSNGGLSAIMIQLEKSRT
jgi:quercetin dioxygenase-like cupin family protein